MYTELISESYSAGAELPCDVLAINMVARPPVAIAGNLPLALPSPQGHG